MPGGFRRKRARENRRVRVDGNGLRREVVGAAGLGPDELAGLMTDLDARADQLERQRRVGWAVLPTSRGELRELMRLCGDVAEGFADVLLLTSPEIALGVRALAPAPTAPPGVPPASGRRLHVVDGPDPDRFRALVETLEWPRTLVVVASAGVTDPVTTGHLLVVRDRLLRELGAVAYRRHIVVAAPPGDATLGQIVHDEGFRAVAIAGGGRDTALAPAVLFPLACLGVDVGALLAGAEAMLERRHEATGLRPAHLLGLAALAAAPAGLRVATPSVDALRAVAGWMEHRLESSPGATGGPRVTLVLRTAPEAETLAVPKAYQDVEGIGCVGGLELAVLATQAHDAHEMALWAAGELTVGIALPDGSARSLGELAALTEAAACLAESSSDDAPSIHARATRLAFGLVDRAGYESERANAERLAALREERWVA